MTEDTLREVPTAGSGLVKLYYSLVRPQGPAESAELMTRFRGAVGDLFYTPGEATSDWDRGGLLAIILQARDLAGGKGEYGLFYLLMGELFLCTLSGEDGPSVALQETMVKMMRSLVEPPPQSESNTRPYGSWKDFRAVLSHLREVASEEALVSSDFFRGCIGIIVDELVIDAAALEEDAGIGLIGKWAPREKNKRHGWLARFLADALDERQEERVTGSARLGRYRTLVSRLNRKLKTVEVAQCAGDWGSIDFEAGVPARTMQRQSRAFLYPQWSNADESPAHADRLECRKHYLGYMRDCARGTSRTKNAGLSPRTLVREAIWATESDNLGPQEAALAASALDLQWWQADDEGHEDESRGAVVPVIDTSCEMSMDSDDPLCAAIGMGIRLAETSVLGRRLITFGAAPTWVSLEDEDTLTNAVRKIRTVSSQGGAADVLGALELVASACVEQELSPESVAGLSVVILSDAAEGSSPPPRILHRRVTDLFRDAGLRSAMAAPYPPPHMVYWGLRTRQPLPCSVTQGGVSLISGYHLPTASVLSAGRAVLGGVGMPSTQERALSKILAGGDRYRWVWEAAEAIPKPEGSAGWLW